MKMAIKWEATNAYVAETLAVALRRQSCTELATGVDALKTIEGTSELS